MDKIVSYVKTNQQKLMGGILGILILLILFWLAPSLVHAVINILAGFGVYLIGSRVFGPMLPVVLK